MLDPTSGQRTSGFWSTLGQDFLTGAAFAVVASAQNPNAPVGTAINPLRPTGLTATPAPLKSNALILVGVVAVALVAFLAFARHGR